jgi:hypothetical protein
VLLVWTIRSESRAGYLYLTDTSQGPAGLSRPDGVTADRQARREAFLAGVRAGSRAKLEQDPRVRDYSATTRPPSSSA